MDVVKGIQSGARFYLAKPFKIDELLAKVKKALGE
jgi:DNA-binding response OmpR family regulator